MTLTQIILTLFLFFALSRVILRFRGGSLSKIGFFFWSGIFSIAIVTVLLPDLSSKFAVFIGIGRGVDAIVYASIALLFYLIFRIHIFLEDIRHEITELVRRLALKEFKKDEKKTS